MNGKYFAKSYCVQSLKDGAQKVGEAAKDAGKEIKEQAGKVGDKFPGKNP